MEWFDSHAHLSYADLASDLDRYLAIAQAEGLVGVIAVGTDVSSSRACVELAEKNPMVWASVGIHPNESAKEQAGDWEVIQHLAQHPRVVALGETGLDLYWDDAPLPIQQASFRRHLQFSEETGLPVVIHTRDCEAEMLMALQEFGQKGPLRGVMHSFTGSWETARACLDWGLYISFAGMATYKNAESIRQVASQVPADKILVETDCPFLSPHPCRGQRPNHPALVVHTGRCLAGVRRVGEREFAAQTTENARRLFRPQVT